MYLHNKTGSLNGCLFYFLHYGNYFTTIHRFRKLSGVSITIL